MQTVPYGTLNYFLPQRSYVPLRTYRTFRRRPNDGRGTSIGEGIPEGHVRLMGHLDPSDLPPIRLVPHLRSDLGPVSTSVIILDPI